MATKTLEQKYQDKLAKAKVCSVCYRVYKGFGNNAAPITVGRCCDECSSLVIRARVNSGRVNDRIKVAK